MLNGDFVRILYEDESVKRLHFSLREKIIKFPYGRIRSIQPRYSNPDAHSGQKYTYWIEFLPDHFPDGRAYGFDKSDLVQVTKDEYETALLLHG